MKMHKHILKQSNIIDRKRAYIYISTHIYICFNNITNKDILIIIFYSLRIICTKTYRQHHSYKNDNVLFLYYLFLFVFLCRFRIVHICIYLTFCNTLYNTICECNSQWLSLILKYFYHFYYQNYMFYCKTIHAFNFFHNNVFNNFFDKNGRAYNFYYIMLLISLIYLL
jgi:hypothetical protein